MNEVFYYATKDDITKGELQLYSKDSNNNVYVPIIGTPHTEPKYKNPDFYVKEIKKDGTWQMAKKTNPVGGKKRKTKRLKRLKRVKRRSYKNN